MKHFGAMRRSLGIATAFNFLGPLIILFGPVFRCWGFRPAMMTDGGSPGPAGTPEALVVHAHNGMDEISYTGITYMAKVDRGQIGLPGWNVRFRVRWSWVRWNPRWECGGKCPDIKRGFGR